MRIALIGSVTSSVAALEGLLAGGGDVVAVAGLDEQYGARVSGYADVAAAAGRLGIDNVRFRKVSDEHVVRFIAARRPDVLFVIGISQLVPDSIVDACGGTGVGFHPTELPLGRGRAPVAWTLLMERTLCVSLFMLTAAPDAGAIVVQRRLPRVELETARAALARLDDALRETTRELAPRVAEALRDARPQDDARATHYPKRVGADGVIDFAVPCRRLVRFVRAVGAPYPGAYVEADETIRLHAAEPCPGSGIPGTVLEVGERHWVVCAIDSAVRVTEWDVDGVAGARGPLWPGRVLPSRAGGTWDDPELPSPTPSARTNS